MKRLLVLPLLLLAACAMAPELEPDDCAEQARAVQAIESITGMKFKGPVSVYHFSGSFTGEDYSEDSAGGEVIGFYDTEEKRLYLTREAIGKDWYFGLRVHEATHALQDQLYNLDALDAATASTDEYLALQALIEGHAECVMADAMGKTADTMTYDPAEIEEPGEEFASNETDILHAFEYGVGLRFVRWLKAGGGYRAVDAAFGNPPVSTEQVLHSEKYLREHPDRIEIDRQALQHAMPGWELGEADCLGELGVLTMLAVRGNGDTAAMAAAGWGGDVMLEATRGKETVGVWLTTWDTAQDAAEFRRALGNVAGVWWRFESARPQVVTVILGDAGNEPAIAGALRKSKIKYHAEP